MQLLNVAFPKVNSLVPNKPHYGHCNVKNAHSKKSIKNWSLNFEFQICGFTIHVFQEKKNSIWSCTTIKIRMNKRRKYCKQLKILQVLENTVNTHKYNTCTMSYFSCLEVCYVVFFFGLCSLDHVSISGCIKILINAPTRFSF